jgi:hypothetical protein
VVFWSLPHKERAVWAQYASSEQWALRSAIEQASYAKEKAGDEITSARYLNWAR